MQDTIVQPVTSQLLDASATSLATTVAKNVVPALFLNPGTWLVTGFVNFNLAAASTTVLAAGINTVITTLPTADAGLASNVIPTTTITGRQTVALVPQIINVGANGVNLFLNANATFSAGTVTASGDVAAVQLVP